MPIIKTFIYFSLLIITIMSLFSCTGQRPNNLGIYDGKLTPCPSSPNCVSSDAHDKDHNVLPFELIVPAPEAWLITIEAVLKLPGSHLITQTSDYIHAECSSAIFGFVDDLELHLRHENNSIAVRSASRLGRSDFGVNRKRIEILRSSLIKMGASK